MDIKDLKLVLEELHAVGINQVRMDKSNGGTLLRGANEARTISIYHEVDIEFSEAPIGIQNVKGLLSRINLFDADKASVDLVESRHGNYITDINIKQSRKKVSFRCGMPDSVLHPTQLPGDLTITNPIPLDSDYVAYLSKAFAAMGHTGDKDEKNVSVSVSDDTLSVVIFDGESDSFADTTTIAGYAGPDAKGSWDIPSFQRVMKYSSELDNKNTATFGITEHRLAVFKLGITNVVVLPVS